MNVNDYIANINNVEGGPLPDFMATVCPECPWRKEKVPYATQAHPAYPDLIFNVVENLTPMACHMGQKELQAFSSSHGLKRCRGIEIYRANTNIISELEPDTQTVFANKAEALERWPSGYKGTSHDENVRIEYFKKYPLGNYTDTQGRLWKAGKLV